MLIPVIENKTWSDKYSLPKKNSDKLFNFIYLKDLLLNYRD